MARKEKKIQVSGNNDLKIDLWGNVTESADVSKSHTEESDPQKGSKRFRIKGRLLKSGKGLKPVTEIYEWPTHLSIGELNAILSKMKRSFGCGGTIKATHKSMELQGDRFEQSKVYLEALGFVLIRSGG